MTDYTTTAVWSHYCGDRDVSHIADIMRTLWNFFSSYLVVEVIPISHVVTCARASLYMFMNIYWRRPVSRNWWGWLSHTLLHIRQSPHNFSHHHTHTRPPPFVLGTYNTQNHTHALTFSHTSVLTIHAVSLPVSSQRLEKQSRTPS